MASFLGGSTVGGWEQIVAMREHAFIRQGKQVSSRQKYLFQVFFKSFSLFFMKALMFFWKFPPCFLRDPAEICSTGMRGATLHKSGTDLTGLGLESSPSQIFVNSAW